MEHFLQILVLFAFMVAGWFAARIRAGGRAIPPKFADTLARITLFALLLTMGFRLGNDGEVSSKLASIGLLGLSIAAFSLAGTFVFVGLGCVLVFRRLPGFGREDSGERREARSAVDGKGMKAFLKRLKDPLVMVGFVLAGLAAGLLAAPSVRVDLAVLGEVTKWVLNLLLFLIGMQFSQSGVSLKGAFLRPDILLVPALTAAGTLCAGLLIAPLFGIPPGRACASCAGFGWYTLSGLIIADLGDPMLGSAAFLGNILRESMAIVLIPFLARGRFPQLAIGAGGATAMDVTLPVIERSFGPGVVPASFASGVVLSLLVPVLVPLLYKM